MKILRPICCGLDVHKNVIVATIGITDMNTRITEYIQDQFSTINFDLFRLKDWLAAFSSMFGCLFGIYRQILDCSLLINS